MSHGAARLRTSFDDPNLVSCAGLAPVMALARRCDLHGVVAARLRVPTDKESNASGRSPRSWRVWWPAPTRSTTLTCCATAACRPCSTACTPVDAGVVPAGVHPRPCPAVAGRVAAVPGPAGRAGAVVARRRGGHVRRRRLAAAQGLRQAETGRGVRSRQDRRLPVLLRGLNPLNCHDQHPGRGAGDRCDPAARREHRLRPGARQHWSPKPSPPPRRFSQPGPPPLPRQPQRRRPRSWSVRTRRSTPAR